MTVIRNGAYKYLCTRHLRHLSQEKHMPMLNDFKICLTKDGITSFCSRLLDRIDFEHELEELNIFRTKA